MRVEKTSNAYTATWAMIRDIYTKNSEEDAIDVRLSCVATPRCMLRLYSRLQYCSGRAVSKTCQNGPFFYGYFYIRFLLVLADTMDVIIGYV